MNDFSENKLLLAPGVSNEVDWLYRQVLDAGNSGRTFLKNTALGAFGFSDTSNHATENQDRFAIAYHASRDTAKNWLLGVVCDGVGGSGQGAHAASLAVAALATEVGRLAPFSPAQPLERALRTTHEIVLKQFGGKSNTTLVAFLYASGSSSIAWVGDSRAYSATQDGVRQLSLDDTLAAALHRAKPDFADELSPEYGDRLSQAIGADMQLKPNIKLLSPSDASAVLLMTDGVWKTLGPNLDVLAVNCSDMSELMRRLVLSAEWLGAKDNATALSVPASSELRQMLASPNVQTPADSYVIELHSGTRIVMHAPQSQAKAPAVLAREREAAPTPSASTEQPESPQKAPTKRARPKAKATKSSKKKYESPTTKQLVIVEDPDGYESSYSAGEIPSTKRN